MINIINCLYKEIVLICNSTSVYANIVLFHIFTWFLICCALNLNWTIYDFLTYEAIPSPLKQGRFRLDAHEQLPFSKQRSDTVVKNKAKSLHKLHLEVWISVSQLFLCLKTFYAMYIYTHKLSIKTENYDQCSKHKWYKEADSSLIFMHSAATNLTWFRKIIGWNWSCEKTIFCSKSMSFA